MKKSTDSETSTSADTLSLLKQAAAQLTDEQDDTAEKHNALHYVEAAIATLKPNA